MLEKWVDLEIWNKNQSRHDIQKNTHAWTWQSFSKKTQVWAFETDLEWIWRFQIFEYLGILTKK